MIDGSHVGGNFEDDYMPTLQRLEESGWSSGGGYGETTVNAGFYRQEDKLAGGAVEATQRLDLLDEQGLLLTGYTVEVDEETGTLVIGYEGERDERFDKFIDDMVAWGDELEARQ